MPHLTYEECVHIQVLLDEAYTHRQIAVKLWRSNGCISREIREYTTWGVYLATLAWLRRKEKRALCNTLKTRITPWSSLEDFIHENIVKYWSPDQIAWDWKRRTWETCSKDTIYKYIYSHYPWWIKQYLRRKGKRYISHREKVSYIPHRKSIHDRPAEVEERKVLGHREWDTVRGKNRKWGMVTYVERASWYLLAGVVQEKKSRDILESSHALFMRVPLFLRKTVTFDNGREFVDHMWLAKSSGLETYFADPYCSWQRWTNENTNGLLRQFFPKKTDLRSVTQEQLETVVYLLNTRPRKRLSYLSPLEFLSLHNCVLLK